MSQSNRYIIFFFLLALLALGIYLWFKLFSLVPATSPSGSLNPQDSASVSTPVEEDIEQVESDPVSDFIDDENLPSNSDESNEEIGVVEGLEEAILEPEPEPESEDLDGEPELYSFYAEIQKIDGLLFDVNVFDESNADVFKALQIQLPQEINTDDLSSFQSGDIIYAESSSDFMKHDLIEVLLIGITVQNQSSDEDEEDEEDDEVTLSKKEREDSPPTNSEDLPDEPEDDTP